MNLVPQGTEVEKTCRSKANPLLPIADRLRHHLALLASVALVLLISVFRGHTQQAPGVTPSSPLAAIENSGMILWINPDTWEVLSPDGDQEKVTSWNTPDMLQGRALAAMAIRQPDDYVAMVEPDAAKRAAAAAAAFASLQPNQQTTPLTPAQLASINAFLHPSPPQP